MNPQPDAPRFSFVDAQALPWTPSACADGVHVKNLGKANGRAMQLVRFEPGTVFPTHLHTGPEFIYMLEGEAVQNGQRLLPGWVGIAEAADLGGGAEADCRRRRGAGQCKERWPRRRANSSRTDGLTAHSGDWDARHSWQRSTPSPVLLDRGRSPA